MSIKKEAQEDVLSRATLEMAKTIESFLRDKKQFKRYHKSSKKEGNEVIQEHISKKADTKAMRDMVTIMKELIQIERLLNEMKNSGVDAGAENEQRSGVVILAQRCSANKEIAEE